MTRHEATWLACIELAVNAHKPFRDLAWRLERIAYCWQAYNPEVDITDLPHRARKYVEAGTIGPE